MIKLLSWLNDVSSLKKPCQTEFIWNEPPNFQLPKIESGRRKCESHRFLSPIVFKLKKSNGFHQKQENIFSICDLSSRNLTPQTFLLAWCGTLCCMCVCKLTKNEIKLSKNSFLQSVTKYLRLTLVFMKNMAPRERFNCYFSGLFC